MGDLIKKVNSSLKQGRHKLGAFQAEYTAEEEALGSPAELKHGVRGQGDGGSGS